MKLIRNIMAAFRLKKAFTLVELSVVLMVSGLLVAAGLQGAQMMSEQAKIDDTKKKLDEIETALISFAKLYERIPYPARRDIQMGVANFGVEDSATANGLTTIGDSAATSPNTVRTGVVPVSTLGLPAEYMFDGYGNRITYAMVKGLGTAGTGATQFSGYTTALTTGVITINDSSGTQVTYPHIKAVVAYALVSHGKDGKGAFSRAGSQISGCSASAGDNMNCETAAAPDNTFRDAPIFDVAGNAAYYDDYIRWKTLDRLKTQANLTTIANLPTCSTNGQCLVYSTTTSTWGCGACGSGGGGGDCRPDTTVLDTVVHDSNQGGTTFTKVINISARYISYGVGAYSSYIKLEFLDGSGQSIMGTPAWYGNFFYKVGNPSGWSYEGDIMPIPSGTVSIRTTRAAYYDYIYYATYGSTCSGGSSSGMPSCTVAGQQPVYNGSAWECTPKLYSETTACDTAHIGALARGVTTSGGEVAGDLYVCKEGTTPIEDTNCDAVGVGMISYEIDGSQYVCKNQ